jgi:hypothetical protein
MEQKPELPLRKAFVLMPFDLRPYRIIRYSVDFVEAPKLLQSLNVVAEKLKVAKLDLEIQ